MKTRKRDQRDWRLHLACGCLWSNLEYCRGFRLGGTQRKAAEENKNRGTLMARRNGHRDWLREGRKQRKDNVNVAEAPSKVMKGLRYVGVIAVLTLIVAAVILFYVPFITENSGYRHVLTIVYAGVAIALYFAFGREYYRRHPKEHRVRIIICSGLVTALAVGVAFRLLFGPLLSVYVWVSLILLFAIGAFASDQVLKKLGKKRFEEAV